MRITQEQFEKIAETYSHACLREGVVYLRNCRLCGYNATRDVRPESTGSHFIRGDAGLLSHVGSFHSERPLTKEDLHQTCKEERVGYNDAVLMSKGIPPKGVVMIRNATYDMPYEQFKRKRNSEFIENLMLVRLTAIRATKRASTTNQKQIRDSVK